MKNASWLLVVIIAIVAYFIGVKYPATGTSLLAKVGM
jgi:hypothetical protein